MCAPWGSFLVEQDGTLYFKDGVLSHTALMEEYGFAEAVLQVGQHDSLPLGQALCQLLRGGLRIC